MGLKVERQTGLAETVESMWSASCVTLAVLLAALPRARVIFHKYLAPEKIKNVVLTVSFHKHTLMPRNRKYNFEAYDENDRVSYVVDSLSLEDPDFAEENNPWTTNKHLKQPPPSRQPLSLDNKIPRYVFKRTRTTHTHTHNVRTCTRMDTYIQAAGKGSRLCWLLLFGTANSITATKATTTTAAAKVTPTRSQYSSGLSKKKLLLQKVCYESSTTFTCT